MRQANYLFSLFVEGDECQQKVHSTCYYQWGARASFNW